MSVSYKSKGRYKLRGKGQKKMKLSTRNIYRQDRDVQRKLVVVARCKKIGDKKHSTHRINILTTAS